MDRDHYSGDITQVFTIEKKINHILQDFVGSQRSAHQCPLTAYIFSPH